MDILTKIPNIIHSKPVITRTNGGNRFVVIDYIMYQLLDESITLGKLMSVWIRTNQMSINRDKKTFLIKDKENTTKLTLHEDYILSCECLKFRKDNTCKHTEKVYRYFL